MKKILTANNSSFINKVISNFLEEKYEVIEVENGNDAITVCRENHVFLALISSELSERNGMEVATELRKSFDHKQLPLILNTSSNNRKPVLEALDSGFSDYIVQPFPKELLFSKINKFETPIDDQNFSLSKTLSSIPFFRGVPEFQVAHAINNCSKTVEKDVGEQICVQGEKNFDLYVLLEGKCDVMFNSFMISEIEPVETIGEMGFIEETQRSTTVIPSEPSVFLVFNKEKLDTFLNEDRAISEIICKNVIHTLCTRIKNSNDLINQLKIVANRQLVD